MIYSGAGRFADGATIAQCCSYEAFDRVGNAQLISRVGITLGEQSAEVLTAAKASWMDSPAWQPLRKMTEQVLCVQDWATTVIASDLVDKLLDSLIYRHLDEEAIVGGAGAYSLLAQHVGTWYGDHRKWLDHLYKTWLADAEHVEANKAALAAVVNEWLPRAVLAAIAIAQRADEIVPTGAVDALAKRAGEMRAEFAALGLEVNEGA